MSKLLHKFINKYDKSSSVKIKEIQYFEIQYFQCRIFIYTKNGKQINWEYGKEKGKEFLQDIEEINKRLNTLFLND